MPKLTDFPQSSFPHLPPKLLALIENAPIPGLGAGPIDAELSGWLRVFATQDLSHQSVELNAIPPARMEEWVSGLWLLAGDLDRSHSISQDVHNSEGSFLHAIMHRREGDFSNAKYWFRKVGEHPVIDMLNRQLDGRYGDGASFVDRVSQAIGKSTPERMSDAMETQWLEWQLLMQYISDEN